jgi:hypothetical protein
VKGREPKKWETLCQLSIINCPLSTILVAPLGGALYKLTLCGGGEERVVRSLRGQPVARRELNFLPAIHYPLSTINYSCLFATQVFFNRGNFRLEAF